MGFDVLIIDHRGQGLSGRMLSDTHRGHVDNFSDYVDDLAAFWQQEVQPGPGENAIFSRIQWAAPLPRCSCSAIRISVMPLRSARPCLAS
jgi:pimeloyl-ACP methyl ester carboxylesterase